MPNVWNEDRMKGVITGKKNLQDIYWRVSVGSIEYENENKGKHWEHRLQESNRREFIKPGLAKHWAELRMRSSTGMKVIGGLTGPMILAWQIVWNS